MFINLRLEPTDYVAPCPFCGSTEHLALKNTHTACYWVACDGCEAEVFGEDFGDGKDRNAPLAHKKAKASALAKWNRRPVPGLPPLPAQATPPVGEQDFWTPEQALASIGSMLGGAGYEPYAVREAARALLRQRDELAHRLREEKTATDLLHQAAVVAMGVDHDVRKILEPVVNATGPTPDGLELTPARLAVLRHVVAAGKDGYVQPDTAGFRARRAAETRALDALTEAGLLDRSSTRGPGRGAPYRFTATPMGLLRAEQGANRRRVEC